MTGSRAPTFSDLADVISTFVRDGQSIAPEGFTHLIPFGAAHEIIRQERRNLTLIRMTPDIIYDQMIGIDRKRFVWGKRVTERITTVSRSIINKKKTQIEKTNKR